ncbi:MAG: hypothetical protein L0212_05500 [Acidobacteria bacterium]|nr:hypothetical protein [Acidobacteriota bacterium]
MDQATRAALAQLGGSRRGRLLTAAADAGLGVLRSAARGLHSLWLEVTGFFFAVFAALGAAASWREYRDYVAAGTGPGRLLLALLFTLMFAWFGITSFRRARQKS